MRVLFTTRAYVGHYRPMVPLARALRGAGHEVAVASGALIADEAAEDGLTFFEAGPDRHDDAERRAMFPEVADLAPGKIRPFFFGRVFTAYELPLRAAALDPVIDEFAPDVIVHEVAEFAAPMLAAKRGLPYATHAFGPVLADDGVAAAAAGAAPYWEKAGLQPHPRAGLWEHLYLDIWPPSMQRSDPPGAPAVQLIRTADAAASSDVARRRLVYVTLGTVYNTDLRVFRAILQGLSSESVDIVVTVGRGNDPAALGPQPPNVRVEQFIPQEELLPACAAVVAHGGAGSTLGALSFGCPLLIVPQGADQFTNAERVTAVGAGIELRPADLDPVAVRDAVRRLLGEQSFGESARRIAGEIAAMPDPDEAAAAVAALASG